MLAPSLIPHPRRCCCCPPAVQAISDTAPSKLLDVLLNKGVKDVQDFVAANKAALTTSGVDLEAPVTKARLLALAAVCTEHLAKDLPYAQAAAALQVPEADVERWVIDGTLGGVRGGLRPHAQSEGRC